MHVVLVRPEIAPNTGAIIRLCANTGCALHLVEPLGFDLSDRLLKRGGLDYHEHADMTVHPDLPAALSSLSSLSSLSGVSGVSGVSALPGRVFGFSSAAATSYVEIEYRSDDAFVFGAERSGLSTEERGQLPASNLLTIPMRPGNRSLNLANAVSIIVYEAWRQQGFAGAGATGAGAGADRPGLTVETLTNQPFDL